jgi:hypothetical protein
MPLLSKTERDKKKLQEKYDTTMLSATPNFYVQLSF